MSDLAATVSGTAEVGGTVFPAIDWSTDGDLVGDLPDQVRTITGSAITQATITLAAPEGETPGWWSPWRRDALEGQPVTLTVTVDGVDTVVFVGTVVAHTGDTATPTATFTCLDLADRLHRPVMLDAVPAAPEGWVTPGLEPQWVIDRIVRTAGFHATAPLPDSGVVVAGTLSGSTWPEAGRLTVSSSPQFGVAPWGVAMVGGGGTWRPDRPHVLAGTLWVRCSLQDSGYVSLMLWDTDGSDGFAAGSIGISAASGQVTVGGVAAGPLPADGHVTVRLERTSAGVDVSWDNGTGTIVRDPDETLTIYDVAFGDAVGGIVVGTEEPEPWTPNSDIDRAVGTLDAVPAVQSDDGWELVRQIAEAEQGAVWVDRQGVFRFRSRHSLRGIGATPIPVTSTDRIAQLGWTVDDRQRAGTVEIPVATTDVTVGLDVFGVAQQTVTVWEADQAIRVNPQRTVTLTVDLDGAVLHLDGRPRRSGGQSWYRANTARDGSGDSVPLAHISAVQVGSSQARITLRNTSGSRLWLVDSAGDPALRLTGRVRINQPDTDVRVVVANTTGNPTVLSLPASPWRQDPSDVETLARWLAAETAAPLPQLTDIEVVADLSLDRGTIIRLVDDHATALDETAVVIGTRLAGSPGQITQHLSVRVLQPTFEQFNDHYAGLTFEQFNALWDDGSTFADFNRRPLREIT